MMSCSKSLVINYDMFLISTVVLSKAIDCCNHEIVLDKLYHMV